MFTQLNSASTFFTLCKSWLQDLPSLSPGEVTESQDHFNGAKAPLGKVFWLGRLAWDSVLLFSFHFNKTILLVLVVCMFLSCLRSASFHHAMTSACHIQHWLPGWILQIFRRSVMLLFCCVSGFRCSNIQYAAQMNIYIYSISYTYNIYIYIYNLYAYT